MLEQNSNRPVRSSERVLLRIPIRVEGKDKYGHAFVESTHTLVINRAGGLIALSHLLQPGEVIRITNIKTGVSSPFQVVSRAPNSLSGNPEWGVKCLEPELGIWGVHFPTQRVGPLQTDLILPGSGRTVFLGTGLHSLYKSIKSWWRNRAGQAIAPNAAPPGIGSSAPPRLNMKSQQRPIPPL